MAASLSSASPRRDAGGRGDLILRSMLPVDGTLPHATSGFEKRDIAREVPVWHSDICIQCGNCVLCLSPRGAGQVLPDLGERSRGRPVGAPSPPRGLPRQPLLHCSLYRRIATGCGQCAGLSGADGADERTRRTPRHMEAPTWRETGARLVRESSRTTSSASSLVISPRCAVPSSSSPCSRFSGRARLW